MLKYIQGDVKFATPWLKLYNTLASVETEVNHLYLTTYQAGIHNFHVFLLKHVAMY